MHNRQALYDRDRPLRKDAARNRQLLIQSAREVFAARGIEASMDDIAAHAQLGVGTAYRHFANKYELANAIFDRAVERLVASAESVITEDDSWEALRHTVEALLDAQAHNRAIRDIVLCVHADDCARHDQLLAPLAQIFARAKSEGRIRANAEYGDLVTSIVMLCALSEWAGPDSVHLWRRYLPPLLDALRPVDDDEHTMMLMPVEPLSPTELHNIAMRGTQGRLHVS